MRNNPLSNKELKTLYLIRNSVIHEGVVPSIRNLMRLLEYRSPYSVSLIINKLIKEGFLVRSPGGKLQLSKEFEESSIHGETVNVPLIGVVACGMPMLAEENIEDIIPVSVKLATPPHKYFLLRASGDSMNKKGINDGDLALVRSQQTAHTGDKVVALIDNEATIKELVISDEAIILKPHSINNKHKPIILTRDFKIQGIVIAVVPKL